MLLNCGVGEDSWVSLGLQEDIKAVHPKGNQSWIFIGRTDCWSWNSNILATWCEELTPWKRPWCWERLKARGEGDVRGWDGWMASLTHWTWVWINSRCWWWTGRPGVLQFIGSQRVGHDWATELTELIWTLLWELLYKCLSPNFPFWKYIFMIRNTYIYTKSSWGAFGFEL